MIVILAIIALIAVPIILNIIGKSKKATFARSIDGLVDVVRIDHHNDDFNAPREYFYNQGELTLLTVNHKAWNESVEINGKIDGNGFIYVDEDGTIRIDSICNKEYCANGESKEIEITENGSGTIPEVDKEDPVITLNGDATIYVEIGGTYQELGAIAQTRNGKKLEYMTEFRLNGSKVDSIDTSREGVYQILYQTSNNHKTVSVIRTVTILEMAPVITMTESSGTYEKEKEVLITVSGVKPNNVESFTYEIKKDNESIKTETVNGLTKTILLNEMGIYEVVVTATDDHHHTSTVSRIYKIDTLGPVIVFDPEIVSLESEEVDGYNLFTGVTVTDNVDGVIDYSKIKTSGTLEKISGTYRVMYTVSDSLGNSSSKERTFVVADTTKPEIVIRPNEESGFVKSKTVTITATDNIRVDSITYVVIKDNVRGEEQTITNGGKVTLSDGTGNYVIEVTAIDSSGNSRTVTSGIYKIDNTKPSITVPENTNIKITEVTGYDLMTGVVVSDNSGVTSRVETTGSLTAILGEQIVTYKAIDEAGNEESVVRKFTVVEAEGPILNFSNASTGDIWTQEQTIIVTATDNSNLKTFTYEVIKDGVSKGVSNVSVSGKSASADVILNESGIYNIKLIGSDEYNNTNTLSSGEYKIDVTEPSVGSVTPNGTMGSNGWYTSDVTFSVVDGSDILSGHKSTTVSPTSITSNTTGKSVTVTTIDNAGNTKSKTFGPYKIDKSKPTFTVKSSSVETVIEGENHVITSYFNTPDWSVSGEGSIVCQSGSTTITNTNSLAVGTHEITCTATGVNGLTQSASKPIEVSSSAGWIVADKNNHGSLGNVPTLNGLVPIKYKSANDSTTKWYDYENQMWANAVSVSEEYRNATVGTAIPEEAIKAYFVWIPRYEYNYTNLGTSFASQIHLNFIPVSKVSPNTDYKIHPAFAFGEQELSGIWVGKFETTGIANELTIKPNLKALTYYTVSKQFELAQRFSVLENSYGISTSADAHMMKNSEWGAVAYLSQSKYGKYGNSAYSGNDKEVYKNNNQYYLTGCSGGAPSTGSASSCAYTYEKAPEGTGASTTGTIYGVYGMSGGALDVVMGVYNSTKGSSGFSSLPASKYYDNYTSTTATSACNSGICYGHALSETSGWYGDRYDFFVTSRNPWLSRGGSYNDSSHAGIFYFCGGTGGATYDGYSFRVVLLG